MRNIYKYFHIYISHYAKRIARKVLSSSLCNNRLYIDSVKKRALSHIRKYEEKLSKGQICPDTVEIELTNFCNLDCIFCPNSKHRRKKGIMDFGVFKRIVDEVTTLKVSHVVISGFGEPLIDKGIIEKLDYIYDKKVECYIELVTNGFLLTEKMCNALCAKQLVNILDVSIDASNAESYKKIHNRDGFNIIMQNLTYLNKIKKKENHLSPFVSIRFKVSSFNKGQFKQFVNRFWNIVDEIKTYANIFGWPESNINISSIDKNRIIKIPCPNLWESIRINWNGDVILCCMDYEGKVILGNVNGQSLLDIWNGLKMQNYRQKHKDFQFDCLRICKDCDINSHLVIPW